MPARHGVSANCVRLQRNSDCEAIDCLTVSSKAALLLSAQGLSIMSMLQAETATTRCMSCGWPVQVNLAHRHFERAQHLKLPSMWLLRPLGELPLRLDSSVPLGQVLPCCLPEPCSGYLFCDQLAQRTHTAPLRVAAAAAGEACPALGQLCVSGPGADALPDWATRSPLLRLCLLAAFVLVVRACQLEHERSHLLYCQPAAS